MPVRMTDLLDGWEDGSVELPPPAGMSPERIKERTMEKIRQTKRPRRRMGVRLLACAALAAVFTVSAMAAYHLWGPGELFDPFFTLESAPLNGGQKELLDQIGATDLPPVTSNGVTLTPLAAVADEHTLYLRLRLEAPEGTVLPDRGEQEDHIAHDVELVDADTGERLNWGMQKARFLPDDTPGDNSLELVFMLLGGPNGANWVDGTSKTLTITGLRTEFLTPEGPLAAVDGVDLAIPRGSIVGLVGESGCGKSVTALSVLGLVPPAGRVAAGEIRFGETDLRTLGEGALRKLRGNRIAMIFQDPMTSLNPVYPVGRQVAEVLRLHRRLDRWAA